ncbi:NAD(P)-dependent dehydrogenase (short-subunit alcohol dehydrogenase family) [Azospirillum canadense]|nr:NAD(P)-dependent dehydrogenase (short-subunit alcohol dehydrogenase family) [Azospirillum canadense]
MRKPDPRLAELYPDRVLVQALDVTDQTSVDRSVEAGVEHFGGLDVVVNNAAVSVVSVFEATPHDVVRTVFETNLFGVMNVLRSALPHLRAGGGGTIVNISSGVGLVAVPLLALYVASKHAIEGLSEALAYELESQGINVKLIEPGAIRTTNFAANTMSTSESVSVPESYRAYFDNAIQAMVNYPFPATEEELVVETILRAATDCSSQLRYPIGPDTEEYTRLRWSTSEDCYRAEMSRLVGHASWRERT